jgi:hypothetical protein
MAFPTYEDANLILRLYELRREEKMRAAREWFVKNARFSSYDEMLKACPPGSQENAYFRQVTSYWEMVASFVNAGVLHHELFFQSGREMLLVWVRVGKLAPALREAYRDKTAWKNLETVAGQFIEWMSRNDPESFEAFAKRIG